jgi:restriction system protein
LVDGPRLLRLVKLVQDRGYESSTPSPTTAAPDTPPFCPVCGKVMILRTARRGQNAGNRFWGCADYPGCNGVRQV